MTKRILVALFLCCLVPVSQSGGEACAAGTCAEQFEFCQETAEGLGGEYIECCSGFCLGPQSWQCNNDSNQCRCVDIDRVGTRSPTRCCDRGERHLCSALSG